MGRYEIQRKSAVQEILKVYAIDEDLRKFIDEIYFSDYVKYQGKLRLAIRHNIELICKYLEERDE